MDYGKLLSRAWEIIWEYKWLVLLGILVALGTGGNNNGSPNVTLPNDETGDFSFEQDFSSGEFDFEEASEDIQDALGEAAPWLAVGGAVLVAIICIAMIVGLALWVLGNIARGGLIAGVNQIETMGASTFKEAWNAGWQNGMRLVGIGLVPVIPALVMFLVIVGVAIGAGFSFAELDQDALAAVSVGLVTVIGCTICLFVLVAVVLKILRALANRAAMLENLGVFESYGRAWQVLRDNIGEALLLMLIHFGISLGIGLLLLLPGLLMALCCILWPLMWVISGAISAYFSALWTLAWRKWTGMEDEPPIEPIVEAAPSV